MSKEARQLDEPASLRQHFPTQLSEDAPGQDDILRELKLILASEAFRPSHRSQEFLSFVVNYRLDGAAEPLKERAIGFKIFHRSADYDTGADSVVRVLAGEVRRRLQLYYQAPPAGSHIRIDLPVGSYTPVFLALKTAPLPPQAPVATPIPEVHPGNSIVEPSPTGAQAVPKASGRRPRQRILWLTAALILLIASGGTAWTLFGKRSDLDRFWAPLLAPGRPVVIYLPKLLAFRGTDALYKRTEKTPGEFSAAFDRLNRAPNLAPGDTIRFGEIFIDNDRGPGVGDIKASIHLSRYLESRHVDSDVRIGNEFTFEDLRTSPSVLIGAFSNRWTLETTRGLHYSFEDVGSHTEICENGGKGEKWIAEWDSTGGTAADFGLVTRILNPKTGQFTVIVAGLGSNGSDAASEIVTNPDLFAKAVAGMPSDWSKKNIQIVVKASVTDSINGPPLVVGTYIW